MNHEGYMTSDSLNDTTLMTIPSHYDSSPSPPSLLSTLSLLNIEPPPCFQLCFYFFTQLCSQKGFICEVCHNPQVIYPFDLTETSQVNQLSHWSHPCKCFGVQCEVCHSVYHKACHPVKGSCPKCLRLRKRANSVDLFT